MGEQTVTGAAGRDPGQGVGALVTSILDSVAQPVWVVDRDGLICFANPSAAAALGYADVSELLGKPGHQTIHYKRPDGSPVPAEECPMLLPRTTGETVHRSDDWFVRRDGSLLPVEYWSAPINMPSGHGAVVAFTDLTARREAEQAARDRDVAKAHAAELADSEARQRAIFDAALDGVISIDKGGRVIYANAAAERIFGYRAGEIIGRELAQAVVPPSLRESHRQSFARHLKTGRTRILGRRIGITAMRADGSEFPAELVVTRTGLPGDPTFTGYVRDLSKDQRAERELVATRLDLKIIADEQAALRRIATLVAEGAEPRTVFDAVCEETGRLIKAASVNLDHFTPDGANLVMSGWSLHGTHVPAGTRLPLEGDSINALIRRTQAPSRIDSYQGVSGRLAARLRELGIRSEVGALVVVNGNPWGALIAGTGSPEPLPAGAELRVASFAELIGTAVSNATTHSELIESRTRIITASDAARRQVTRDLHDGAQQQFVSAIINLQLAQQNWSSAPERAKEQLDRALRDANSGLQELRDIAAGIHPAILTHRGLAAAIDALAARAPILVEVDVPGVRLPEAIESSIYFFCAEALTNVVKHAQARSASVRVAIEATRYTVEVRDDGIGGAESRPGTSGLIGLRDRIGALNGSLEVASPPSRGTTLRARIPVSREPTVSGPRLDL
jgi:PAS domain S-box-containing protein